MIEKFVKKLKSIFLIPLYCDFICNLRTKLNPPKLEFVTLHKKRLREKGNRKKKYKNPFKTNEYYDCIHCNQKNLLGKNMQRHIDECSASLFEKEICLICKRDCIMELQDPITGILIHKHKCSRKTKIQKFSKQESRNRRKRRLRGEIKKAKNFLLPPRPRTIAEDLYLYAIISDFVNEKRKKRLEMYEEIKKGYPEKYLRLYYSENNHYNFRQYFHKFIGDIGRYFGDNEIDKLPLTIEKAKKIRTKFSKNFDYLNGITNESEENILKIAKKNAKKFIEKNPIPKFRKIRLRDNLMETYLLACAQRREIDYELGLPSPFGKHKKMGFPCFSPNF